MNSIQGLAALIASSGLFISLLAIPLISRRVPPNGFYGVFKPLEAAFGLKISAAAR